MKQSTGSWNAYRLVALWLVLCVSIIGCAAQKGTIKERRGTLFPTPEAALEAFKDAFRSEDPNRLVDIFGEEGRDIIITGDANADRIAMRRISQRLDERSQLIPVQNDNFREEQWFKLRFAQEGWDMRIPLSNKGDGWYFATHHAREAAQSTRIAINELTAMHTLVALVAAQRKYMESDHDGDGIKEYAQRIMSSPDTHDGLFWHSKPGEETSPLDTRVNEALREGYRIDGSGKKSYEGYYYRVLTAQGPRARGGKRSYLNGDNMTQGFAILAYPVEWRKSGEHTYVIDASGVMYKKDLGFRTASVAQELSEHNPEATWLMVDRNRYGEDVKIAPWLRPASDL